MGEIGIGSRCCIDPQWVVLILSVKYVNKMKNTVWDTVISCCLWSYQLGFQVDMEVHLFFY